MAGISAGAHASDAHLTQAEDVLSHLGRVVRVQEDAMDAITALSGSGPAYFALLAEAMIEAGILLGCRARSRRRWSCRRCSVGQAAARREDASVELRESVTSPGARRLPQSAS